MKKENKKKKTRYLIVLDTNIIYYDGDDFSKVFNSNMEDLLLFLSKYSLKEKFELCLPRVVLEERLTQREIQINNKLNSLRKSKTQLKEFFNIKIFSKGDIKKILNEKFDKFIKKNKILIFNYPKTPQINITKEACLKQPPFFSNKKQEYKDKIIWETIKENAKKDKKDYFFITNNHKEFDQEILKKEFSEISKKEIKIFRDIGSLKIYLEKEFGLKTGIENLYGEKEKEIKKNLNKILYGLAGKKERVLLENKERFLASVFIEEFYIENISENLIYADLKIIGKAKFFEKEFEEDSFFVSYPSYTSFKDKYAVGLPRYSLFEKEFEEKDVEITLTIDLNDYKIINSSITEKITL